MYGIVPADLPLAGLPHGLDDAEVIVEPLDGVAALVSVLDGTPYHARGDGDARAATSSGSARAPWRTISC